MIRIHPSAQGAALVLSLLASCDRPSAAHEPRPTGPTIEGRVVDEQGAPVANVSVRGLSVDMALTPRAQTLENGEFLLPVPAQGSFLVLIEGEDPDEVSAGKQPDLHPSGARDVKLVLKNVERTSFLVLDGATGEPIERYGLAVTDGPAHGFSGTETQDLPLREHPRGLVLAHARAGRHVVRVEAPGHASLETVVAPDAGPPRQQTIRMYPGGSVRGRALHAGQAPANASAAIVRAPSGTVWPEADERVEPDSWFFQDCRPDLGDFDGRLRSAALDADGTFRFDDLAPGTYEVALAAPGLGPRCMKQLRVEAGAVRDLGELELGAPAVLRVRVVPPPGARTEQLECAFDGDWRGRKHFPAGDGTLVYEVLGAGLHRVVLTGPETILDHDEKRDVRLAAGETREVVFEPPALARCEFTVRVVRDGRPPAVRQVAADVVDEKGITRGMFLQRTQEPGVFHGALPLGTTVAWRVIGERGLQIAHRERERVPAGPSAELTIQVAAGSLELVLPESLKAPEKGALEIQLRRAAEPAQYLRLCTAGSRYLEYNAPTWSGPRCDLGWIEAGEYEVSVEARADEESSSPPTRFRAQITIAPGAQATLPLGP